MPRRVQVAAAQEDARKKIEAETKKADKAAANPGAPSAAKLSVLL